MVEHAMLRAVIREIKMSTVVFTKVASPLPMFEQRVLGRIECQALAQYNATQQDKVTELVKQPLTMTFPNVPLPNTSWNS